MSEQTTSAIIDAHCKRLRQLCEGASISASDQQIALLVQYIALMHKWNKAYNLTSVRDPDAMLVRHILDSIVVAPYIDVSAQRIIDVGTGPGLPGIPLAIMHPDKHFVLLDSLGKRIRFLQQVVYSLQLSNVELVQARVEEYTPEPKMDIVLSRAFASLQDMLQWCAHLLDKNGCYFALKGIYPEDEWAQCAATHQLKHTVALAVPELEGERHLLIISPNESPVT